ncbi:hypothetical protein ZWY2020_004371 [Hordeum vulgare]|nr:hypothetical protein ZWY2020_004371 [Hordeum vulgare]
MDRRWTVLGMYHHPLTGEYKLLLYSYTGNMDDDEPAPNSKFACHVLELASGKPLRRIVWPDAITITLLGLNPHVLFHGSLHWYPLDNDGNNTMIVVFNATSESFRQMRAPIVTYYADLFEIDDMLSMSAFDYVNTIDIWVLEDYEREVWVLNCRIELHCERDLVVLVKSHDWLLEVGMDGKLVATFHRKEVELTHFRLKQTLVPHTFFPTLKGYVVNSPPFI